MQTICILGRQPALGLAELESRFGSENVEIIQPGIALLKTEGETDFNRLGGTIKAAKFQIRLNFTNWHQIVRHLRDHVPQHLVYIPEGKITMGMSVYGLNLGSKDINAAALSLKKTIRQAGRSARVVPNQNPILNTAQILHNNLTGPNGMELLLIKHGNTTILAQTKWVQDIEAYRRRDQERPMRDARVGMLPPKLAQTILNLAVGQTTSDDLTVLDPFCGTGVLLQETLLMGYGAYGTDLDPRMVEYSEKNLDWLFNAFRRDIPQGRSCDPRTHIEFKDVKEPRIEVADATNHTWHKPFDTIATETYLGRPFSSAPDEHTLQKVIQDVNSIAHKFLENVARQTESNFRICIAVPAWHVRGRVKHLPLLDHLEKMGYNRVRFVHAATSELVYHREGQIVGRELVVLIRK